MHDLPASLKYLPVCVCVAETESVWRRACVCARGNKRAELCDTVPCVSVNNSTLVIGIEY